MLSSILFKLTKTIYNYIDDEGGILSCTVETKILQYRKCKQNIKLYVLNDILINYFTNVRCTFKIDKYRNRVLLYASEYIYYKITTIKLFTLFTLQ